MYLYLGIFLMALSTYIIRVLPMLLFKKPIESPFIKRFLHYIPYSILTAMTVPAIFKSTALPLSAWIGTGVALLLAWKEKSLLVVSMSAVLAAYIIECIF